MQAMNCNCCLFLYQLRSYLDTSRLNTSSAFTLIELLVVIAMWHSGGHFSPSLVGLLNRQRISSVRSDLVQVLRQSQQTAIQRRQAVAITVEEDEDFPPSTTGLINSWPLAEGYNLA